MNKFRRRIYHNFEQFYRDFSFIMRNRKLMHKAMKSDLIPPPFRERLMLAVTIVNGCRYCSYYHAKQALTSGLTREEIKMLLNGIVEGCPKEEAVAIFYAQHWAETGANPDLQAKIRLIETYGEEKAEAIELVLRMIRMGNLIGNTFDYFLYHITFGHLGFTKKNSS